MKFLWSLFIAGQILSAGNMNYQQEAGYYEINPIYGRHPSRSRIYATKIVETIALYGLTKALPKYKKEILVGSNAACWGFIVSDRIKGIGLNFRW